MTAETVGEEIILDLRGLIGAERERAWVAFLRPYADADVRRAEVGLSSRNVRQTWDTYEYLTRVPKYCNDFRVLKETTTGHMLIRMTSVNGMQHVLRIKDGSKFADMLLAVVSRREAGMMG